MEPRRQVHPARSHCRCSRRRRRHRGARALFYPGFLLSPEISGDISKGRPGSRHGGQGLPLLPHCQEGKLQLGGAPGQRGGQGRGRMRPPHTCTSGLLCHLTLCTSRFLSISPTCCASPDRPSKCSLSRLLCGSAIAALLPAPGNRRSLTLLLSFPSGRQTELQSLSRARKGTYLPTAALFGRPGCPERAS